MDGGREVSVPGACRVSVQQLDLHQQPAAAAAAKIVVTEPRAAQSQHKRIALPPPPSSSSCTADTSGCSVIIAKRLDKKLFCTQYDAIAQKLVRKRVAENLDPSGMHHVHTVEMSRKRKKKKTKSSSSKRLDSAPPVCAILADAIDSGSSNNKRIAPPDSAASTTRAACVESSTFMFTWKDPGIQVFTCCRCKTFFPTRESLLRHRSCVSRYLYVTTSTSVPPFSSATETHAGEIRISMFQVPVTTSAAKK